MPVFDTFHFTTFASLTLFVKDNYVTIQLSIKSFQNIFMPFHQPLKDLTYLTNPCHLISLQHTMITRTRILLPSLAPSH
jgi:hypothetical protein